MHPDELNAAPPAPPPADAPDTEPQPPVAKPEDAFKWGPDPTQPDAASEPVPGDDVVQPYELVPQQYQALADAYTADAQAIAADAGIPAQEMEVMLHLAMGGALEAVSQDLGSALSVGPVPGVDLSNERACRGYLARKYGDQAPIIIAQAQEAYAKLPEDVRAYLDRDSGTGELLTNSPHVLLALAARNLGWTKLSKASATKELAKLNQKDKLNAFDLDKRRILTHIVSRGKSRDAKIAAPAKPAKVVPIAHAAIQKRMDAIRRDPNYYGGDARLRKVLIAEMTELHTKLAEGRK